MFELSVKYFSSVEIDFNIERIVDKNLVVLLVVNFEKSISEDGVRLLNTLECTFELSSC